MNEQALKVRRKYYRDYYRENRERILQQQKEWRKKNSGKVAEYNRTYWKRKAQEMEQEHEAK